MEAAIKKDFDVTVELVRGGGGIFDVHADGELLFSKQEHDRFPEESEILESLKAKSA